MITRRPDLYPGDEEVAGMWRIFRRVAFLAVGASCALATMALAPSTPAGWQVTDHARLADIAPAEIADFIDAHPGLTPESFSANPAVVTSWWNSVSRAWQQVLVERMPEVIGNLAGVDYASRNTANRAQLALQLARAEASVARNPADPRAAQQLGALKAIGGALAAAGVGRRYLVELTADRPPLAAVAIGSLDTARTITVVVPGMGTQTTDMQLWTRAAQNIYDAQGDAGATRRRAVVAWVGYRTPPEGMEATRDGYATRGALLLERDLSGIRAARGERQQPVLNLVAHSYGATTAALALSEVDLHVSNFVMLGSAGVDMHIRTARDLHAGTVYAAEASADLQARWGRIDRRDPIDLAFGANRLGVDGTHDLLAVTGHEPIVHSPWNDDPGCPLWSHSVAGVSGSDRFAAHQASQGYLDRGTQSLAAIAKATTPALPPTTIGTWSTAASLA